MTGASPPQRALAGPPLRQPIALRDTARGVQGRRFPQVAPGARRYGPAVLSVVSHNINGLGAVAHFRPSAAASASCPLTRAECLTRMYSRMHADVVLLQETHCHAAALASIEGGAFKDWQCHWAPLRVQRSTPSGGTSKASRGVAILVRKRSLVQNGGHITVDKFVPSRCGRLAHIQLSWMGHKVHVASVYLPNDAVGRRDFIARRLTALADSPEATPRTCVWGGDFNFTPDPALDRITNGQPAMPTHPDAGTAREWAAHLPDLMDSFRCRHPTRREYTYRHSQGASRLDRVYVSTHGLPYVAQAEIASRRHASGTGHLSDHRPVTMRLLPRTSEQRAPRPRTGRQRTLPPRVHTEFLNDADLADQYRQGVAELAGTAPASGAALLEWWTPFKQHLARFARYLNTIHRRRCEHRVALAEGALEALEAQMAAGSVAAAGEVRRARQAAWRSDVAATRALQERTSWLHPRELPSPGLTARLRPPSDAACGPSLRTLGGHLVSTPGACAEIMVTHYAAISAQPTVDAAARAAVLAALNGHAQLPEEAGGSATVDEAEVKAALGKARPSAAGLDGLKVKLYRAARDTFIPLLARVFSAIGVEDRMPPGYHTGVIVPLHKGGQDRTRAEQYRPITLLNVDYRLLAAVLGARLGPLMPGVIDPVQTAFLRNRSIGENIWFLQLLPHVLAADNRSAVVAVCDFMKAYDTVDREFLFDVMRRFGASATLLRWVGLLLHGTQARALVMGQLSRLATFDAGVRQGCPLAAFLYLFVAEALLCFLKSRGVGIDLPPGPDLAPLLPRVAPGPLHVTPSWFDAAPLCPFPASLPRTTVARVTAVQFADDSKVFLNSFADVPHFLACMHTFGLASGQRLSLEKTRLLEIGRTLAPQQGCVEGLQVVQAVKALGVCFHSGTAPATARWDELQAGITKCFSRLPHVRLSAFGRGFATAAYGVSRLLHAAENVGLPAAQGAALLTATAAVVDRDESPRGPLRTTLHADAPQRRFSGVRRDLISGHPTSGGLGTLPFAHHLTAREAKWALRLLVEGTSRLWGRMAWTLLARAFPPPPGWVLNHVLAPSRPLPPPLRRLLLAAAALPALSRRAATANGSTQLSADGLPVLAMFGWRLHRHPDYTTTMLALGTPAWPNPPPLSSDPAGTTLWTYSVRLGTHLLTQPAALARAIRFQRFVEEAGGALPPGVTAMEAMRRALTALWRLPLPNTLKQTFWYCFLDALPTAARLHRRHPCGCGAAPPMPDRRHHFADCPVAAAVIHAVSDCAPHLGEAVLSHLRTASPPAGVHAGVWSVVALAACSAMEAGRRALWSREATGGARRGAVLAEDVACYAVDEFWSVLTLASRAPLPLRWRRQVGPLHPFLRWDAACSRWRVHRPTA